MILIDYLEYYVSKTEVLSFPVFFSTNSVMSISKTRRKYIFGWKSHRPGSGCLTRLGSGCLTRPGSGCLHAGFDRVTPTLKCR